MESFINIICSNCHEPISPTYIEMTDLSKTSTKCEQIDYEIDHETTNISSLLINQNGDLIISTICPQCGIQSKHLVNLPKLFQLLFQKSIEELEKQQFYVQSGKISEC